MLVDPAYVHFWTGLNRRMPATDSVAERLVVSDKFVPGNWKMATWGQEVIDLAVDEQSLELSANDWAVIVLVHTLAIEPISVKPLASERLAMLSRRGSVL
jgi:hypothetical protein